MNVTPSTTSDHETSTGYTGLLYSSTPVVVSDTSNSYQSPHAVSQYENEVPASLMTPQPVTMSSFTLGSNPSFGLPQDGNGGLFSDDLNLASVHVDLSEKFAPKAGSWECNDCSVFNEECVTQCVACGSINPNTTVTSTSSLGGSSFATSSGVVSFGSFKLGGTTLSMATRPASVPPAVTVQSSTVTAEDNVESEHSSYVDEEKEDDEEDEEEEGSDIDIDSEVVVSSEMAASSLAARFAHKSGDWECNFCFVSNEKDISQCIACGNSNPNITIPASSTSNTTTVSTSFGSGFKLSVSLPTAQPSQPTSTTKLCGQSCGDIKLSSLIAGISNTNTVSSSDSIFKLSYSFPTTQISEPTSAAGGFKLGDQSSGGFKLGGLNIGPLPNKPPLAATVQSSNDCVVTGELKPSEEEIEMAQRYMLPPTFYNYKTKPPCPGCRGCEDDSDVPTTSDADTVPSVVNSTPITTTPMLFRASGSGLQSFASLAKTAEFQFGYGEDKTGFAGAGTMLFKPQKEDSEDNVNPEAEVDVDFKPLVSLPDTYQVSTGQESEEQSFCERAKLYRYDPNSKQWKERGIGNMTIMKNPESGKSRLVMRREQVLKLCCNHVILPTMQLNPMLAAGNAWRWFTPCDFSEEEPKAEQFAIRFKKKEQADSFQEVISRCIEESTTVSQDATEKDTSSSVPTEEQQFSADIKFCGEDKKGFAGAGTMLFKPQKEDSEDNVNPEAEVDVDFKPLVSLPDTYQIFTGQESEEQSFCERARLYRYDPNSKQWKERGIGNMTIMKNPELGKSRLVMRREQVLKLCCNHVILPTMQLNPMLAAGNAWRWFTPCDFSEEEPKAEQFAIRFKKKEQADSFQEVISRCIEESTTVSQDATEHEKDASSSAPTEEQQFSADIKFYPFEMENKNVGEKRRWKGDNH